MNEINHNEEIIPHNNFEAFNSIGNDIENNIDDDAECVEETSTSSKTICDKIELDASDTYNDVIDKCIAKKRKPYLHGADLMVEWKKCNEENKASAKLLEMFEKIAKNYSTKFRCKNKCDEDANINYATFEAFRKFQEYNPAKSPNIFAFFTQMIKNDLAQSHNELNRYKNHISIDSLFNSQND